MTKCQTCQNWGNWDNPAECRPFRQDGCQHYQTASAAQIFFQARGIYIPDLDPRKWAEALEDPPAAQFYFDVYRNRYWYNSGSGRTRVLIEPGYILVFDRAGSKEHQWSLELECKKALQAADVQYTDPKDSHTWPVPGQVGEFPIGSWDPLWEGCILVGCLPR